MDEQTLDFYRWSFEQCYQKSNPFTIGEIFAPFFLFAPMLLPVLIWVAFTVTHVKGF
jgi:hypothetical protein